jgi:hypothetical protein
VYSADKTAVYLSLGGRCGLLALSLELSAQLFDVGTHHGVYLGLLHFVECGISWEGFLRAVVGWLGKEEERARSTNKWLVVARKLRNQPATGRDSREVQIVELQEKSTANKTKRHTRGKRTKSKEIE